MQDVFKAAALVTDAVFERNFEAINKQLVGIHRLAPELFDLAHFYLAAVQVGVKQAQAMRRRGDFFDRCGACQQQYLVRHLRRGNPDFLAIDYIMVALAHRHGFELERVQAGVGLGHTEASLRFAIDDGWQPAALLLVTSMHHHGMQAEHIHMNRRRTRQSGP